MPGYGQTGSYGSLSYKQDIDNSFLSNNKINATTGVCIAYAIKPDQGQGYAFYLNRNVPEAWVWPDPMSDPLTILDSRNQKRYLILDEVTGRWFEVGTRPGPVNSGLSASYQDKASDHYAGTEIPTGLKLREHIGQAEHQYVEHIETHAYLRPQWETNKGISGHQANGQRTAQEVEIRCYKDGSIAENARTKNVPLGGDFVFDRRMKDHRIQIGFFTEASEFKLAGLDQYYLLHDESAVEKAMSEQGWQDEFSHPFLWLARGPNMVINRATGLALTGSVFGATEGADGYDESAAQYSPTTGLTYGDKTLDSDFTFIYTLKDVDFTCNINNLLDIYEDHGTKYLRITANGHSKAAPLNWNGSGWVSLMVRRDGHDVSFGENGSIISTQPDVFGTIDVTLTDFLAQTAKRFVSWGFDYAVSDAGFNYFYTDLNENHGDALLPMWI